MATAASYISSNIFEKCLPAISTDIARCGSVTLCNVATATGDTLKDIFSDADGNWRNMHSLLVSDFEIKACGAVTNGLYEFIMANKKDMSHRINTSKLSGGRLRIEPFVLAKQKTIINNVYFTVADGVASGGNWQVDVVSQGSIPNDVRWFPIGLHVFISGKTAGGTGTLTSWKVESAAIVGANVRLVLSPENAGSYLTAAELTSPVSGVMTRGTVNVNSYEKWCEQIPGLNNNKDIPFFYEETRYTSCWDELYDEYRKLLVAGNPMYAKYGDVEAVELNKQIGMDFQRRWTEAFWFQKPISALQNINDYTGLDPINTYNASPLYLPGSEGRCIGLRANATGVIEQLAQCNRVFDLQGNKLDLPEFFVELYNISRVRQQQGTPHGRIDLMTDSFFAGQIHRAMINYYDDQSAGLFRLTMEVGGCKTNQEACLGFRFNVYKLIWPAIEIAVLSHPYFDDLITAHTNVSSSLDPVGRQIWVIDWPGVYPGIIASDRVVRSTGDVQKLAEIDSGYACVARNPTQKVTINTLSYTVVVECPQANAVFKNMSSLVPEHSVKTSPYTDFYV